MKTTQIILLLVVTVLAGCATYSHKPIEMHVVDADTNQPLEGVIVVAQWSLSEGSIGGNVEVGTLQVLETVSEVDGRVYFPGWGPLNATKGYLDYRGAQFSLFKPGYNIFETQNLDTTWRAKHPDRSQWDGKVIKMEIFNGSLEEYAKQFTLLDVSLSSILMYSNKCDWKKIPNMVLALEKQKGIFSSENVHNSITPMTQFNARNCGSPQEYFRNLHL